MNYAKRAADLQANILAEQYYVSIYHAVLEEQGLTAEGIRSSVYTDAVLSNFLFEFWNALPDSMSIHRPPFNQLCDLSEEGMFGDDY